MGLVLNGEQLQELEIETQPDVERWVNDFAEFFYTKTYERLSETKRFNYTLPEMRIVSPMTEEDSNLRLELMRKYTSLLKTYGKELQNICKNQNYEHTDEIPDKIIEEKLKLVENQYGSSLEAIVEQINHVSETKIGPMSNGCYSEGVIKLNIKSFNPQKIAYGTVAHEILHALREQAFGKKEKHNGYNELDRMTLVAAGKATMTEEDIHVDTHIVEFFSQLNNVILNDMLRPDNPYAYLIKKERDISLDGLISARNYFLKHKFSLFSEFKDSLIEFNKSLGKFTRKKASQEDIEELNGQYKQMVGRYGRRLKYFVSNVSEYLPLLEVSVGPDLSFVNSTLGCAANSLNSKLFELNRHKKIRHKERPISAFESKMIDDLGERSVYNLIDSSKPYSIAKIAIGEHKKDIAKNWPGILSMSSEDVKKAYFDDVLEKIESIYPGEEFMEDIGAILVQELPENLVNRYDLWLSYGARRPSRKELDLIGKTLTSALGHIKTVWGANGEDKYLPFEKLKKLVGYRCKVPIGPVRAKALPMHSD